MYMGFENCSLINHPRNYKFPIKIITRVKYVGSRTERVLLGCLLELTLSTCFAANTNKCRVCDAQYTTTVLSSQVLLAVFLCLLLILSDQLFTHSTCLIRLILQLREEVRDFFADPESILSKYTKVLQYQNSHRERLVAHHRRAVRESSFDDQDRNVALRV